MPRRVTLYRGVVKVEGVNVGTYYKVDGRYLLVAWDGKRYDLADRDAMTYQARCAHTRKMKGQERWKGLQ